MSDLESLIRSIVRDEIGKQRPANDAAGYLSTAEAASLARVSQYTIRRWIKAGELTKHTAGARLLVKRDELTALLACEVVSIDTKLSPEERARRRFG